MAAITRRQHLAGGVAIGAGLLAAACDVFGPADDEAPPSGAGPTSPAEDRLRMPADSKQPGVPSKAKQPVTVRVLFSTGDGYVDFETVASQHKVAVPFTEAHPHITIKWQEWDFSSVVDFATYINVFTEAAAAGQFYDVLHFWPQVPAESGTQGALLGLNRFIRRDRFDLTDFWPGCLQGATWGNDLYGLFTEVETNLLFYNQELFAKAGAPAPTDKWTWDDILEQALALTHGKGTGANYGFTPIPYEESSYWSAIPWVWANGGAMLNEDQTQSTVDQPEAVAALHWLASLRHTHGVWPTAEQLRQVTATEQDNLFMMGRLAMLYTYRAGLDSEVVSGRQKHGVAVPPPGSAQHANILFAWPAFYLGAATGVPDEAWSFLSWWTGVEAQRAHHHTRAIKGRKLTLANSHPPARRSLALELVDWFGENDIAALEYARMTQPHAEQENLETAFNKGLQPVWRGEQTVESAVAAVATEQNAILAGP